MNGLQELQAKYYGSEFNSSSALSSADKKKDAVLFYKAINASAIDLYQQMSTTHSRNNKNFIFFTPTVLATLSMLYAGAPDGLKQELEKSLHMGELKETKWHYNFKEWSDEIQMRNGYTFKQVQFVAHKVELIAKARASLMHYHPEIIPFNSPKEITDVINACVASETDGKITKLIEEVNSDLLFTLASVALCKGQWVTPFDKVKTKKEVFYNADGITTVEIEMMHNEIKAKKLSLPGPDGAEYAVGILELPFEGDIAMLFFRPYFNPREKEENLKKCASYLQTFMTANIQNLLDNYDKQMKEDYYPVKVGIPKLEFRGKTDLIKELEGTRLADMIKMSDFTGSLIEGGVPSHILESFSEINFTMDEEGAEIAAADAMEGVAEGFGSGFIFDLPFGLALVDIKTKSILGMGQILNMNKKAD